MTSQEKAKDARLKRIYNSSLEEFNQKLAEQNGRCAICERPFAPLKDDKGKTFSAYQDHFHGCCPRRLGKFCGLCNRGLLCYLCNKFVVGIFEKMNVNIDRLAAYVKKWEPILRAKGAYDKPESKAPVRTKKKSVRRGSRSVS